MTPPVQTALVTGASTGIGRETAIALAKQGANLILLARRQNLLDELKSDLEQQYAIKAHVIAVDINDHPAVDKALQDLPETFKNIDVLVNNAGLALGLNPAHETDWSDWQMMINTNCLSLAYLTRQVLPNMVKRNHGHIINIGSIAGSYAYKGSNVYGATKAFVDQFTANLRSDLLGTALKVTLVSPGMLNQSEFSLVRFKGDADKANQVYEGLQPLKAEDIGNSIAWIVQQPAHMNVNHIEIMPVDQALAGPITTKHL